MIHKCSNRSYVKKCSILGGMLIHLSLGAFYLWGTLDLYVASYFRMQNPKFTLKETLIIFPLMSLTFHPASCVSVRVFEKFGFYFMMIISLIMIFFSHFFSLAFSTFWGFFFIYGVIFGFFSGLVYLIPLYNGYKYYPEKRGLISGLILGSYGLGGTILTLFLTEILNPENESPVEDPNDGGNLYFKLDICLNLDFSLRMLGILMAGLFALGLFLMKEYSDDENHESFEDYEKNMVLELVINEENPCNEAIDKKHASSIGNETFRSNQHKKSSLIKLKNSLFRSNVAKWSIKTQNIFDETECKSLKDAFKSKLFYQLFFMYFFSCSSGLFFAANYKNIGIKAINDDSFLNIVGSIGALANGPGRFLWGILFDRFGFHKCFIGLSCCQFLMLITFQMILEIKWLFLLWIAISFWCLGGHPVLFPPFTINRFGGKVGAEVYGFIYFAMLFGNLLQFTIVIGGGESIGLNNFGYIFSVLVLLSSLILCFASLKYTV